MSFQYCHDIALNDIKLLKMRPFLDDCNLQEHENVTQAQTGVQWMLWYWYLVCGQKSVFVERFISMVQNSLAS
jgi:hypothetical protein